MGPTLKDCLAEMAAALVQMEAAQTRFDAAAAQYTALMAGADDDGFEPLDLPVTHGIHEGHAINGGTR